MGLCKCPKKKVTNLFCFEHRVNVCEHCLVASHTKCIVQSYLQWLKDSDYNPACQLCSKHLSDESCGECIRLTCYDVFHFECLNQFARQLPANTAPAGYCCPTCRAGIFPSHNMASPVADVLRQHLAKVNWARAGLGLSLIRETEPVKSPPPKCSTPPPTLNDDVPHNDTSRQEAFFMQMSPMLMEHGMPPAPSTNKASDQHGLSTVAATKTMLAPHAHSVINVDTGTSVRGQEKQNLADARRLFDSTKEDIFNMSHDHDDDKYKRRPAIDWLNKWLWSRDSNPKQGFKKDLMSVRRKFVIVLLIGVIGFLTMIVIFSKFGRDTAENDPLLDLMANPHIQVNPHVKVDDIPFLGLVRNREQNKNN